MNKKTQQTSININKIYTITARSYSMPSLRARRLHAILVFTVRIRDKRVGAVRLMVLIHRQAGAVVAAAVAVLMVVMMVVSICVQVLLLLLRLKTLRLQMMMMMVLSVMLHYVCSGCGGSHARHRVWSERSGRQIVAVHLYEAMHQQCGFVKARSSFCARFSRAPLLSYLIDEALKCGRVARSRSRMSGRIEFHLEIGVHRELGQRLPRRLISAHLQRPQMRSTTLQRRTALAVPHRRPCDHRDAVHGAVAQFAALLLLLLLQSHLNRFLLVLAPFVLEPDANHARRQRRQLHQTLFHQGIGPGIRVVASAANEKIEGVDARVSVFGLGLVGGFFVVVGGVERGLVLVEVSRAVGRSVGHLIFLARYSLFSRVCVCF